MAGKLVVVGAVGPHSGFLSHAADVLRGKNSAFGMLQRRRRGAERILDIPRGVWAGECRDVCRSRSGPGARWVTGL